MEVSLISVVLVFRNQSEQAEQTLQAVLTHAPLFREIIVVDDGSTDLTPQTIESVLEAFSSDRVQFFRNGDTIGKPACVNQLLGAIAAPILWMPDPILEVDPAVLAAVDRSVLGAKVVLTGSATVCADSAALQQQLISGSLCDDSSFLFNLSAIHGRDLFLNPFIDGGVALEWASRLLLPSPTSGLVLQDSFYTPDSSPKNPVSGNTLRQLAWSLYNISGDAGFAELLGIQTAEKPAEVPAEDVSSRNIIERVSALIDAGNFQDAAWLLELLDEEDPLREELFGLLQARLDEPVEPAPSEISGLDSSEETLEQEDTYFVKEEEPETTFKGLEAVQVPEERSSETEAEKTQDSSVEREVWGLKPVPVGPVGQISLFDTGDSVPEEEPAQEESAPPAFKPAVTVIIPTTIDGRRLLEQCLISIEQHENPSRTEVIVVDNGSLDDTGEYLEQLAESGFFNLKIVSNPVNRGVAAAINQGLARAEAETIVFLHNDTELVSPLFGDLEHALLANSEFGVVSVKQITDASQQPAFDSAYILHETNAPGSACMAFRKADGYRFDERYGLAWFEDTDFFMQVMRSGKLLGILDNRCVVHLAGTTTTEIGLFGEGDLFYRNKAAFNKKWDQEPHLPAYLDEASPINQLLAIAEIINPRFPEPHLTSRVNALLSAETRTELLSGYWERENLFSFIRLMAATEHRDLLRTLEDKASTYSFFPELIYQLATYYFRRKIYSRCEIYLNLLVEPAWSVPAGVLRLSVLLEDRKRVEAAALAQWLVDNAPVNADACALSARLNGEAGDPDSAKSFYQMAHDMNPDAYPMPMPTYQA